MARRAQPLSQPGRSRAPALERGSYPVYGVRQPAWQTARVLYVFGFERTCVVMSDLFFIDPEPTPGQEGAERGVRLEVRLLEKQPLQGSIYSAQPIGVGRPVWRADLLEKADGPPAAFDRTHHHPVFRDWEPGHRQYDPAMTAAPVEWVGAQLRDLDGLLSRSGMAPDEVAPTDADDLRAAVPDITETLRRLLGRVHAGELARPPAESVTSARSSWL
jgi:hypothetical protein